MKKLISCMLVLVLMLSLSAFGTGAFAADDGTTSVKFEEMGLTFKLPKEYVETKGIVEPYTLGEIDVGVNVMLFFYVGMDQEAYNASAESGNLTE